MHILAVFEFWTTELPALEYPKKHLLKGELFKIFLAHLSRRLIGELIVYIQAPVRPSTFSNDISETVRPILSILHT